MEIKKAEYLAGKIYDDLAKIDEKDLTLMHDYIAGESKIVPQGLKPIADNIKRSIRAKTEQLVKLGLLPEDILDSYADGYYSKSIPESF